MTARLLFATLALAALVSTGVVQAQAGGQNEQSPFIRCRQVVEPLDRLACYDRLAEAEGQRINAAAIQRERAFGLARSSKTQPPQTTTDEEVTNPIVHEDLSEVIDTVMSVQASPAGLIYRLRNGGTWQLIEPGWSEPETGKTVTIRRARLGGYFVSVDGGRSIRTRRLR